MTIINLKIKCMPPYIMKNKPYHKQPSKTVHFTNLICLIFFEHYFNGKFPQKSILFDFNHGELTSNKMWEYTESGDFFQDLRTKSAGVNTNGMFLVLRSLCIISNFALMYGRFISDSWKAVRCVRLKVYILAVEIDEIQRFFFSWFTTTDFHSNWDRKCSKGQQSESISKL
jgi:hypothetical protein